MLVPAAGEMVQMIAVLEFPPRLACSILVSLLSLKGTWLLPCSITAKHSHAKVDFLGVCDCSFIGVFVVLRLLVLAGPQRLSKD